MLRLTDTVKHLLLINVIAFLVANFLLTNFMSPQTIRSYTTLFAPETGLFKPLQIVTSIFSHSGPRHLIFNMLGLVFLGPMVEQTLGPKRFLTMYLLAGVLSTVPTLAGVYPASLGASGATYAVFVAFAAMFPNLKLMLLFPPIPVKAKYLVLAVVGYDMLFGIGGLASTTAHFAHLVGAAVGFACVYYWGKLNLR